MKAILPGLYLAATFLSAPLHAQDADNRGAMTIKDDACGAAIFRPGEAPIFLDGDAYRMVNNAAATTSAGNLIWSCRGTAPEQARPERTISVEQMCGVFLFTPTGFVIIEGKGKAVLNRSGNFLYRCVTAGNAPEDVFNFVEAP